MLKMRHYLYQILFILSLVFAMNSTGQTFVDVSNIQGINAIVNGGTFSAGLSFADFNHDGWDDLTIGMNNQSPKVYMNNNGDFQEVNLQLPSNAFCKMVVWVDYNNDGERDLFMTNRNGSNRLLRNNGNLNFTDVTSIAGVALTGGDNYGASWGDYDLDGDLDLYVCNYRFSFEQGTPADKNHLFRNDGNDVFTDVTATAGVAGNVDLSFQSAWIDYNHDLLPDLYVINDKISPNRLYRNNGDGSFTEVTGASGIGIVIDSMSASYADYNNDLLMDLYTTNTQAGNVLLRAKEDLTFQDATEETGLIVYDYTWGAVWFDMDNDTDQDIYIAESEALAFNSPNYLYRNMGIEADYTFENVSDLLTTPDISDAYTAASGDFNNDGHIDIAVNNRFPYNAVLWENSGNEDGNGYIKVRLEGTTSNRDGIGSWITVYAGGNSFITYTLLGEQYISQNSFDEHFGLGQSLQADSLLIQWPSGIEDVYYNISTGTTLIAVEGATQLPDLVYSYENCTNGPAVLSLVGGNYTSAIWSTGEEGDNIEVQTSGTYDVIIELTAGNTVTISQEITLTPPPSLSVNTTSPLCFDSSNGSIELFNVAGIPVDYVEWQALKDNTLAIFGLVGGTYNYTVFDINGCSTSGSVTLEVPSPISYELEITNGTCPGDLGSINISAVGGTPPLLIDYLGEDISAISDGDYNLLISDLNGCAQTVSYTVSNPPAWEVELLLLNANNGSNGSASITVSGATPPYNILWSNGQTGSSNTSIGEGTYFFVVQDSNGCDYQENFEIIDLSIDETEFDITTHYLGSGRFLISGIQIQHIEVYNSVGQVVLSEIMTGNDVNTTLDLNQFAKGAYLMLINHQFVVKILKGE
jgi:hypothetical protein